jgi:hypothetical protein
MKTIYKVKTRDGISFNVEASNYQEAQQRASSPIITQHITQMIVQAMAIVSSIEPHRGPTHLLKHPLFDDEFFLRK